MSGAVGENIQKKLNMRHSGAPLSLILRWNCAMIIKNLQYHGKERCGNIWYPLGIMNRIMLSTPMK